MPYDAGPQRAVKAQALIDALDLARTLHPDDEPDRTWTEVQDKLAGYDNAMWRTLSRAAGRPDRVPSDETKAQVTLAVATRAAAESVGLGA